jgi:hypothetical protein
MQHLEEKLELLKSEMNREEQERIDKERETIIELVDAMVDGKLDAFRRAEDHPLNATLAKSTASPHANKVDQELEYDAKTGNTNYFHHNLNILLTSLIKGNSGRQTRNFAKSSRL